MAELTNAELGKLYPKDSVWVVQVEDGVRTKLLYHGNDIEEARKINASTESVLIRRKLN